MMMMDRRLLQMVLLRQHIVAFIITFVLMSGAMSLATDYCKEDTLQAQCNQSQVIYMTYAYYGRIAVTSRCLASTDTIGCFVDVTNLLDSACSGLNNCSYPVSRLKAYTPCYNPDLAVYLQAEYTCVGDPHVNTCNASASSSFTPQASVDYSWFSTTWVAGGLGSVQCPWSVQAQPGQQVTLTIVDFTLRSFLAPYLSLNASLCPLQLIINASTPAASMASPALANSTMLPALPSYQIMNVSLCTNVTSKYNMLNTDFGYRVSAFIQSSFNASNTTLGNITPRFLIQYLVIGCPDLILSPGQMLSTDDSGSVRVTCNYTKVTSYLVCSDDGLWVGQIENCSRVATTTPFIPSSGPFQNFSIEMIISAATGVAVGVITGLLVLGVFELCRRRCKAPDKQPPPSTSQPASQSAAGGGEGQAQARGAAGPYPMVGYGDGLYDDPGQSQGPSRGPAPPSLSQTGQWVFSTSGQRVAAPPPSNGAVYDQLPEESVVSERLHERFNADVVRFVPSGQQPLVHFGYPPPLAYPHTHHQFGLGQGQGQWGAPAESTMLYCYRCHQATTPSQGHQCRVPLPPSQVQDDASLRRVKAEMPLSASALPQQPTIAAASPSFS